MARLAFMPIALGAAAIALSAICQSWRQYGPAARLALESAGKAPAQTIRFRILQIEGN